MILLNFLRGTTDQLRFTEEGVDLGFVTSTSEARRLVSQGAVSLDGEAVRDVRLRLEPGAYLLKAGKRRLARVRIR